MNAHQRRVQRRAVKRDPSLARPPRAPVKARPAHDRAQLERERHELARRRNDLRKGLCPSCGQEYHQGVDCEVPSTARKRSVGIPWTKP